ncbi:hypothetical protein Neosp_012841 [[Neocosmospora] mangrovei]
MQAIDLSHVLDSLASRGLELLFITATLGTIEVCAVDDFPGIANVLAPRRNTRNEIWVHVDAAYAGSALVLDENKPIAAPFENFHSFNFNPQKWLLTTFDCSALWVRNRSHLIKSSLSLKASNRSVFTAVPREPHGNTNPILRNLSKIQVRRSKVPASAPATKTGHNVE